MRSVLCQIGPVPIRAYGLMLWIALVVGLLYTLRAARRTGIKTDQVVDIALYSLIAGIAGAHITSILLDLPYYSRNPSEILALWKGVLAPSGGLRGLSFHGGLAGALLAALLYTRRKRINFPAVADLFSPGLALGYSIARVGCLLNGCCYGVPTDLPWGIRFHVDGGRVPPSHPTQLYASLASLMIFVILVIVTAKRRFEGQVFLSYLALYSVSRFLIEFLRKGVTAEVFFAGLTEAQFVSLIILAGSVLFLYRGLAGRRNPQSAIRNPRGG